MAPLKTMVRSNKAQINYLCRYMAQHPHFAAGDYKTPQGAVVMERQWADLKAALDELGPNRTVEQWKVCWRDQKRKARVEGGAVSKAVGATGNAVEVPDLSENSALILGTIGEEMASGFGPEESPIGFTASSNTAPAPPHPSTSRASPPPTSPCTPLPATQLTPLAPTVSGSRTVRTSRVRRAHPPDRFLCAQEVHNTILKELVEQIKRTNELLQEQNNILSSQRGS